METFLQKTFSSARAEGKFFIITGNKSENYFKIYPCDDINNCTAPTVNPNKCMEKNIGCLEKNVLLDNNFKIIFAPPHGDIFKCEIDGNVCSANDPSKNKISIKNPIGKKTLQIYTKSGLVENVQ